jgi:hypothetical protein
MRHAAAGLLALWHRPPLRLPSGRAVSCVRRAILTCEALGASHFSQSKSKIRFCSDSMSGFAPVLSGFAPAPTRWSYLIDLQFSMKEARGPSKSSNQYSLGNKIVVVDLSCSVMM